MILKDKKISIEVRDFHWPLAIDLIARLGHEAKLDATEIDVPDVYNITQELSTWGIPWKFK
jgi:hypothetical protein